ncbi:TPA: hypothetical protein ACH262_005465, partial [Klebsiella variicola subsp. variicola]
NQQAHKDRQDSIHKQEDDVQNEHTRLENHHNLEGNKFEKEYNDKKAEQRALPGADTRDELLAKAQEFERKHKP